MTIAATDGAPSGARAVTRRAATEADMDFLLRVYAGTRADEMALVPWTAEQKDAFVRQQFDAQHRFYHEHWPDAAYEVLERDGAPIGRLYVDRSPTEISVMDIALLTELRGQGVGTALMEELLAESQRTGIPVRLHVETFNRARSLYARLGFTFVREDGPYQLLEWRPR